VTLPASRRVLSLTASPNLFVVGAAKAGTTSLWDHLSAHPDVFMSKVKEPHFFSDHRRSFGPLVRDPHDYAQLFADGAGAVYRGEASPSYLPDPQAAERIHAAVGDARIIVSLRDPVERAYAHYWTWVRVGAERRTFAEAVHAELALDVVDMSAEPPPFVARGRYAEQLLRFRRFFDSSMLILFFDDFVADVRGTMRTVYEWLDLDPGPAASLDPSARFPFELPRNVVAAAALRVPRARRLGNRVLRGRLRTLVDRAVFRREKPPLDPEMRRLLCEVYTPEDERLRELLGRSLPWDGRE
jgi:hypothetical protein